MLCLGPHLTYHVKFREKNLNFFEIFCFPCPASLPYEAHTISIFSIAYLLARSQLPIFYIAKGPPYLYEGPFCLLLCCITATFNLNHFSSAFSLQLRYLPKHQHIQLQALPTASCCWHHQSEHFQFVRWLLHWTLP